MYGLPSNNAGSVDRQSSGNSAKLMYIQAGAAANTMRKNLACPRLQLACVQDARPKLDDRNSPRLACCSPIPSESTIWTNTIEGLRKASHKSLQRYTQRESTPRTPTSRPSTNSASLMIFQPAHMAWATTPSLVTQHSRTKPSTWRGSASST